MHMPHRQSCHVLSVFVDSVVMRSGAKTIGMRAVPPPCLRRVFKASKPRRCSLAVPIGSHSLPSLPCRSSAKDVRRRRRGQHHIAVNASHPDNGDASFARDDYIEAVIDRGTSPLTPIPISPVWDSHAERELWRRDSATEGWTGFQTGHVRRRCRNNRPCHLDRQNANGPSPPLPLVASHLFCRTGPTADPRFHAEHLAAAGL